MSINSVKSNKILLALQFWDGDRAAAMKLAQFLADLEPRHSDLADFILVRRFDMKEPKEYATVVPALSRKFNFFSYKSPRRGVGWPDGCNSLWFSTMEWVYTMIEARRVPKYKAIFTFEADGCPVLRDWVAQLSETWDALNKFNPVYVAGALVKNPAAHINGNAVMNCDMRFLTWIVRRVGGVPVGSGWDFILRDRFKEWGWADIHRMRSYYNSATFTPEQYAQMVDEKLIWVHGVKDDSMIRMGRARLL
jgi:hypothetical protein